MPWIIINFAVPADLVAWFTTYKDVLTVLITAVGLPFLLVQITQSSRQERERLRRRQIAATATLPLTLSALSGYAQAMMAALGPLQYWAAHHRQGADPVFDGPLVPSAAIAAMEQMIEASPSNKIARALAAIVSDIQVLSSRTNKARSADAAEIRAQTSMIDDNLILAATIYARVEALFDYARSYSDEPHPPVARIRSALNLANLREQAYPRVHQRLDRRVERMGIQIPWYRAAWAAVGRANLYIHRKLWP